MCKVLVTGGAKRIGKAIVERLASDGWDVAIHFNGSKDAAEALAEAVRKKGRTALTLGADLTDEDAVRRLAGDAAGGLGGLSAVVNNASVFKRDGLDTESRDIWDLHMAIHVRAPYLLAEGLMRQLSDGAAGAVVNLVDQRVLNPSRHFLSYTLSKMALWDQTQVLARAMAPRVRVNAIGPGPVLPSTRPSDEKLPVIWFRRRTALIEVADSVPLHLEPTDKATQAIQAQTSFSNEPEHLPCGNIFAP